MATSPEELRLLYLGQIVPRSFQPGYVALSYIVSLLGAACTLELINRRTSAKGKFNHLLLFSSAVTMGGIAIWCMHYIGNRAIDLADGQPALQIEYSAGFTALSFFMPIVVLLLAFVAVGTDNRVSWWRVTMGGTLAGCAVCGMHYLSNASISNYHCVYAYANVVGAALIAVAASIVALSIFFVFRAAWSNAWWKRLIAAVVMACAVSGMHWCAAAGTQYVLIRLNDDRQGLSRSSTTIVIICLIAVACLIIAGTTVATARMKKRYADKAQQVVLAAAVFDNQGRILVSHDGVIPSEKITDSFLGKNSSETFTTTHPLFNWMFQASRNWSGISALIDGMAAHLSRLPRKGRDRDARASVRLISEHGELVDNYDVIFRELFCVAAVALADKMNEQLTSVGVLWDEILATGAGAEERGGASGAGAERRKSSGTGLWRQHKDTRGTVGEGDAGAEGSSVVPTASKRTSETADDLAEKGLQRWAIMGKEYGRGTLMFLVRRVQNDHEIKRLEAAGYIFAEVRQVSSIISSRMQVKASNLEAKLRSMAAYADSTRRVDPGVYLGLFAVRARVAGFGGGGGGSGATGSGFDVLVQGGAHNLLPAVRVATKRLDPWHGDFLAQLDGLALPAVVKKLVSLNGLLPRETFFASQLFDAIQALKEYMAIDSILKDAVLVGKPLELPAGAENRSGGGSGGSSGGGDGAGGGTLIAFRVVVPIHASAAGPLCEFAPLSLFKAHQQASSPYAAAFARRAHRELAPIINAMPETDKTRQDLRVLGQRRIPNRLRRLARGGGGGGGPSSAQVDAYGYPMPAVAGRSTSPSPSASNQSTSTLKLWTERRSSDQQRSPAPSGKNMCDGDSSSSPPPPPPPPRSPRPAGAGGGASRAFGGIMISQEVTVNVVEADDVPSSPSSPSRKSHRRGPSLLSRMGGRRGSGGGGEDLANAGEGSGGGGGAAGGATGASRGGVAGAGSGAGASRGAIEMETLGLQRPMALQIGAGTQMSFSNVEVERVDEMTTFVDELFGLCMEGR